jgi:hypothetical protein
MNTLCQVGELVELCKQGLGGQVHGLVIESCHVNHVSDKLVKHLSLCHFD